MWHSTTSPIKLRHCNRPLPQITKQEEAKKILANSKSSDTDKEKAKGELDRIGKIEEARTIAVEATVKNLKDASFLKGFGSNGGEEFLSYLNISETLVVKGDKDWPTWDKKMAENLTRVQNKDGELVGRSLHHGSNVLLSDRTPGPLGRSHPGADGGENAWCEEVAAGWMYCCREESSLHLAFHHV